MFNEILKLHPKFRPKYFDRSHHIFCIKLDQNKNNKVSFDDIKHIADFVSKKLDIPVSVQADGETISLALFWDTRILGSLKLLDFSTFTQCKALELDQFIEVSLETSFDCETLMNIAPTDKNSFTENQNLQARKVPHLLLDGLVVNART